MILRIGKLKSTYNIKNLKKIKASNRLMLNDGTKNNQ